MTRVRFLQRKAKEFESDARIRFAAEGDAQLEECLDAFKQMINDISVSDRPVSQLERIANRIDEYNFDPDSLREMINHWIFDLVSYTRIELIDYIGIFTSSDNPFFLARLLKVASRIGFSRDHINGLLRHVDRIGNHHERIGEMERQIDHFCLQSPHHVVPVSLLARRPQWMKPFGEEVHDHDLNDYMPHYVKQISVASAWKVVRYGLKGNNFNREGLEDIWSVLSLAHDALVNVPVGFIDLDAQIEIFVSALSDFTSLVNRYPPRSPINQQDDIYVGIIAKLKSITPILEGHAKAGLSELSETRSRLVNKIHSLLPAETRIILQPLLLRFVDRHLANILERNGKDGKPIFTPEFKQARLVTLLELQVDGYIEAIQRGEARISVSEIIIYELARAGHRPHPALDGRFLDLKREVWCDYSDFMTSELFLNDWEDRKTLENRFAYSLLRSTFAFADRFGVNILTKPIDDWETSKMKNFRILIAASIQLGFTWNPWDDWKWGELAQSLDCNLNHRVLPILYKMVASRNFLKSLNEDEPAPMLFSSAQGWLESLMNGCEEKFNSWVTGNVVPIEFFSILRERGLPSEHIRNILRFFDSTPERLEFWPRRVEGLYRTYRRRIAGPVGASLRKDLYTTMHYRNLLLRIEIEWGLLHADDDPPDLLTCRNLLETVFREALDLLDIGLKKVLLTVRQKAMSQDESTLDTLRGILYSLFALDPRRNQSTRIDRHIDDLASLSSEIKRAKQTIIA